MPLNITYSCPECSEICRASVASDATELLCEECQSALRLTKGAAAEAELKKCLVCPSDELFLRKDFPQRLGVFIVVLGFVASSVAWSFHMLITTYAILFATALIDVTLYLLVGDLLECYRCHAQYRGVVDLEQHEGFDLEIHERHRQTQARLQQAEAALASEQASE
jgi:hypothetical protein